MVWRDNAADAAEASLITEMQSLLSTSFAVALISPGRGERVEAVGAVVRRRKRLLFCETKLYGDFGIDYELITKVPVILAVVSI